jgi:hypothetical protein
MGSKGNHFAPYLRQNDFQWVNSSQKISSQKAGDEELAFFHVKKCSFHTFQYFDRKVNQSPYFSVVII